jgi:hypothetical protein
MARDKNPYFNGSGCPDPTAYFGLKEIIKEEKAVDKQVSDLIHVFKVICNLAGFEIVGRVQIKHKNSGRVFK